MRGTVNQHGDKMVIEWIRLRIDGLSSAEIARRYDVSPQRVRIDTQRVRAADAAESGEDVEAFYWDVEQARGCGDRSGKRVSTSRNHRRVVDAAG